jgi:pyruvate formate lyase activating enzyme
MLISGLQKLTLLDYPGRVACTVFTGGCNFRCPFCHNATLVLPERLRGDADGEETVLQFLKRRQGVLEGVAITGGEPLLHPDMPDFLRKIRAMGYKIKLDTNGSFPERLAALVEEGLVDRVAMDVKNAPALYAQTVGLETLDFDAVTRSKDYLLQGKVDYEFRTTVVRGLHTAESLKEAAAWIRGAREYYLQQYKNSGEVIAEDGLEAFSEDEMRGLLNEVREIIPTAKLRGLDEEKQ